MRIYIIQQKIESYNKIMNSIYSKLYLCTAILLIQSIICLCQQPIYQNTPKVVEILPKIPYEFIYEKAADNRPTILFLHGFPSSMHIWRHQLHYFYRRGYGYLVPNLMGYGTHTYSPLNETEYSSKTITDHLIALLNHVGLNKTKVYVVGHDWGSRIASRFVLYHPERTIGAVLISIPYTPPVQFDLDLVLNRSLEKLGYESIGYWKFFRANDAASLIEKNLDSFIDLVYANDISLVKIHAAPGDKIRAWVTNGNRTTRATYLTSTDYSIAHSYLSTKMQQKLNWFKAVLADVDWNYEKDLDKKIKRPVLFIEGQNETIGIVVGAAEGQKQLIANLTTVQLSNTGHWVMEQRPDQVNEEIDKWIKTITPINSATISYLLISTFIFSLFTSFYVRIIT